MGAIVRRSNPDASLTDRQYEVLKFIENNPGCTNFHIASALGMSGKTSKVHLSVLLRNEYVSVHRPGGMSRKAFWYAATALERPVTMAQQAASQCPSVWQYAQRLAAC